MLCVILKVVNYLIKTLNEMEKMKAVVCTNFRSPEVLQIKNVEKPVPENNEVLIKIHPTSVTAAEML